MNNIHKKILVIAVIGVMLALPAATFIFMPREEPAFSENENRYLAKFQKPELSGYIRSFFNKRPNNIKDRRFMEGFEEWFADRFAMREDLIILQNELETLQGKTEINGVFTVGDRMILAYRENSYVKADAAVKSMDAFAQRVKQLHNIDSYAMIIPSAQEIYMDALPPNSHPGSQAALIKRCYDSLENVKAIDVMTYLAENSENYIYYRTDHHWTTYGAYWGYYAAALKLGLKPYDLVWFDVEHASSDFRGTLYSRTLNSRVSPDVVSFYTLSPERTGSPPMKISMTVTTSMNADGAVTSRYDSLYMREYLEKKDKYLAFLGQNSPIIDITAAPADAGKSAGGSVSNTAENKNILIFKDSFANCMLPFLINHYNKITVLDMRFIKGDIREYINLEDYSQILFMYSATNLAEETDLSALDNS